MASVVPEFLELEDDPAAEPAEVELRALGDGQPEDFEITEGMVVAQIAADAEVIPEIADNAAAIATYRRAGADDVSPCVIFGWTF